jgi:Leucine-rich repeat (LRR) protein
MMISTSQQQRVSTCFAAFLCLLFVKSLTATDILNMTNAITRNQFVFQTSKPSMFQAPTRQPFCKPIQKCLSSTTVSNADKLIACNFINISNLEEFWTANQVFVSHWNEFLTQIGLLINLKSLLILYSRGSIPSTIGCLAKLIYFDFSGNELIETIPSTVGSLTELTQLNMSSNLLKGTIPSSIASLTKLEYLFFYVNKLTWTIPFSLGSLSKLIYSICMLINLLEKFHRPWDHSLIWGIVFCKVTYWKVHYHHP